MRRSPSSTFVEGDLSAVGHGMLAELELAVSLAVS
jgi:hypothetical protein